MCLLNGDVSGALPASTDFATIEKVSKDGKTTIYSDVPVKDIIFNAVENYGNELPFNIILNDLEDCGYELLEYRGDTTMYVFVNNNLVNPYEQITLDKKTLVYIEETTGERSVRTIGELENDSDFVFNNLTDSLLADSTASRVYLSIDDETAYTIAKVISGNTAGYRQTEVTYAGELIGGIGDSITSILDKIV